MANGGEGVVDGTMWASVLHAGLAGTFLKAPHVGADAGRLRQDGTDESIGAPSTGISGRVPGRKGERVKGQQEETEGRSARPSTAASHDPRYADELERRLAVVEAEDYEDPARADLPTLDYLLLAALVVVTTVVAYVWGY